MKARMTEWLILRYLALSLFAQKRALHLAKRHAGVAGFANYLSNLQLLLSK